MHSTVAHSSRASSSAPWTFATSLTSFRPSRARSHSSSARSSKRKRLSSAWPGRHRPGLFLFTGLWRARELAHQSVRELQFLTECGNANALVPPVHAGIVEIVECAVDAVARKTAGAGVDAVRG